MLADFFRQPLRRYKFPYLIIGDSLSLLELGQWFTERQLEKSNGKAEHRPVVHHVKAPGGLGR